MTKQTTAPKIPRTVRQKVRLLARLRNQFGDESCRLKLTLLRQLAGTDIRFRPDFDSWHSHETA